MSGDVVEKVMAGELVGEVVGFMHPTAEWCHRDYSAVSVHCQIGGPAPVSLIRQSEAASVITSQAAEIERLKKERDAAIDKDWVAAPAYAAKVEQCRQFRDRAEAAEASLAPIMSERLSPGALMAALEANHAHKSDPGRKGCGIEKAIRAYLRTLTNGGENGR